jgi:hypothetical protein
MGVNSHYDLVFSHFEVLNPDPMIPISFAAHTCRQVGPIGGDGVATEFAAVPSAGRQQASVPRHEQQCSAGKSEKQAHSAGRQPDAVPRHEQQCSAGKGEK